MLDGRGKTLLQDMFTYCVQLHFDDPCIEDVKHERQHLADMKEVAWWLDLIWAEVVKKQATKYEIKRILEELSITEVQLLRPFGEGDLEDV